MVVCLQQRAHGFHRVQLVPLLLLCSLLLRGLPFQWQFTQIVLPSNNCCFYASMPPGKSWNCVSKIFLTWKVLENEVCPGKSCSLLSCDAVMGMQTPKCVHPHTSIVCSNTFFAIGCCYHAIYVVSNCSLCLYIIVAGLRQGPGKMLLGSWKVLEFLVTKRVGSLCYSVVEVFIVVKSEMQHVCMCVCGWPGSSVRIVQWSSHRLTRDTFTSSPRLWSSCTRPVFQLPSSCQTARGLSVLQLAGQVTDRTTC